MSLKYTPKPLVEEHYHIQELIDSQEKRVEDRNRTRAIEKQRDDTLKYIAGFKDTELLDFYCDDCNREFVARAKKHVDNWNNNIAYYKIKHTCGKWCMRHITDRFRDKYFFKSRRLAKDRVDMFNDTLQSFQTGFNMVYGKK